jgi:hypothetical protein
MNRLINMLCNVTILASSVVAGSVMAQGAVSGELRDLKGSVMVLKGKDYVNGNAGMALGAGDRVLVLEKALAKVVVNSAGQRCEIDLKENQAFTLAAVDCKALIASVQTVPGAGVPGGTAVTSGVTGGGAVATGAGGDLVWFGGMSALFTGLFVADRQKASGD